MPMRVRTIRIYYTPNVSDTTMITLRADGALTQNPRHAISAEVCCLPNLEGLNIPDGFFAHGVPSCKPKVLPTGSFAEFISNY